MSVVEEKTDFEKRLLGVAKELERLERMRQFKLEFEQEMAAAKRKPKTLKPTTTTGSSGDTSLQIECFDDPSYSVDDVRHANFVARNRARARSNANVIKTLVYRVPEVAYVVKKTRVLVHDEKPMTPPPEKSMAKHHEDDDDDDEVEEIKQEEPPPPPLPPTSIIQIVRGTFFLYSRLTIYFSQDNT